MKKHQLTIHYDSIAEAIEQTAHTLIFLTKKAEALAFKRGQDHGEKTARKALSMKRKKKPYTVISQGESPDDSD